MQQQNLAARTFWKRPEGVMGIIVLLLLGGTLIWSITNFFGWLTQLASSILGLSALLLVIAALLYLFFDPKMRQLIWYLFQSVMRWFTGFFIQIDPIGILKGYVEDLRGNVKKMYRQIGKLRAQMHILLEQIHLNKEDIASNLNLASEARENDKRSVMILKSRKAGRLQESNMRLEDLYRRMELLYKVLTKMYENSVILAEDIEDQVDLKEKERKVIHAGHSAMQSAMNVISGNTDQRLVFDRALEAVADDVAGKVGEMEQFMELSENFMSSIDLQKGIFEEKGLELLEKWEKQGESLLLGQEKKNFLEESDLTNDDLKLPEMPVKKEKRNQSTQYDAFFD